MTRKATQVTKPKKRADLIPRAGLYAMLMNAPAAVCIVRGPDYVIELANPSFVRLCEDRKILGCALQELFAEEVMLQFREPLAAVAKNGQVVTKETSLSVKKEGGSVQNEMYSFLYQAVPAAGDELQAFVMSGFDITELVEAHAALERLTLNDPLTGLLNRRGLQKKLDEQITLLREKQESTLVVLVDLDKFKEINNSLGHAVGDIALKEVAERLQESVKGFDHLSRVGGDEFMLFMPKVPVEEVHRIAERLRLAISSTAIPISTGTLTFSASLAVMMLTEQGGSIDELLTRAHQVLSRSKELGGNRVSYGGAQFDDTLRRLQAEKDRRDVLMKGHKFTSVKHPIVRLQDEVTIGYEFLTRLSVDSGLEMPDNFFRFSAEQNILTIVDHHCLRLSLRAAVATVPQRYHVNLYPSTMIGIPVDHLLAEFPREVPLKSVCIEISEQQILGDPSYLLEPVRQLRRAGLTIAVDDVGFGNSSLESLVILEPDIIKIDKRCARDLEHDAVARDRLKRYQALAISLGAKTIIEGIETRADMKIVRDMGFELGQGFLWGRPE